MSYEYKDDVLDNAIDAVLESLDPEDNDYLQQLNAIANLVGKRNDAVRNANDAAKMKQTEELAKCRRILDYIKIGAGIAVGLFTAWLGNRQFEKTMIFEDGGGFQTSSQAKRMAKEKRKETDPNSFKMF